MNEGLMGLERHEGELLMTDVNFGWTNPLKQSYIKCFVYFCLFISIPN